MGRVVRITLAVPGDVAAFVGDLDTPPALAGALLAEVITASTRWHVGPPWPGEDAAPVGVVLLLRDRAAQRLLDGTPDTQAETLRRAALVGDWLFIEAEAAPALWPVVAVYPVDGDTMRRAEDSRDEWAGQGVPSPSARFDLRRLAVN